jgi:hypothetical protein
MIQNGIKPLNTVLAMTDSWVKTMEIVIYFPANLATPNSLSQELGGRTDINRISFLNF